MKRRRNGGKAEDLIAEFGAGSILAELEAGRV